ncbi:MAG: hypothetical protein HY819_24010 [Acidobacteria bacterium]|nr:hypothetical protein [Acidobacteriota bacterium]
MNFSALRKHFRSAFLGLALLASVSVSNIPATKAAVYGSTEALLLSCIDYRVVNETEAYMSSKGLRDKYDHIVLAGASLGATNTVYPSWGQTFIEHVDVAIKLHNIHKVIILDHRDCGAYRVFLKQEGLEKDRAKENKVHLEQMNALADTIQKKYPQLDVELAIIDLEGKVEELGKKAGKGEHSKESHH